MYSWAQGSITGGIDEMKKDLSTEISYIDSERNNSSQKKGTKCHTRYPLIDKDLTYIDEKLKEMEISMEKMKVLVRRIQRIRAQTRNYIIYSRW
jgi:hypothetical protein